MENPSSTPKMDGLKWKILVVHQKWMVYKGTSQSKVDDDWGYPHDLGNLHDLFQTDTEASLP
jgi:hypothetical protein